jgi:hypothetical protein
MVVEADDPRVDDRLAIRDGLVQYVGVRFLSLHLPQAEQHRNNGASSFHGELVNLKKVVTPQRRNAVPSCADPEYVTKGLDGGIGF